MSARRVQELQELDRQLQDWEQQRQRCGLSAYRERQQALQDRLAQGEQAVAQAQHEIATKEPLLPRLPELQEEVLAAMMVLEELPEQLHTIRADLEEVERELAEAIEEESLRLQALDQRLSQARQQRSQWLAELGQLGQRYLRSQQRHGQALAGVHLGRCGRCRMQLPEHEQRQLRLGHPQPCSSCQSLLVQGLVDTQSQSR